jgi:Holliday junction resolvasome RuvABC endonuclease subunit
VSIIGIDPGVSGGMAFSIVGKHIETFPFEKATEADVVDWIKYREYDGTHAFIERVSSSPQMGVVSAFTFGKSYGFLRGILTGLGIPYEEVTPATWQKAMGCLTKGDKNVSKARCQQLFPQVKATHAIADAVLIAEYGRRLINQRNGNKETANG